MVTSCRPSWRGSSRQPCSPYSTAAPFCAASRRSTFTPSPSISLRVKEGSPVHWIHLIEEWRNECLLLLKWCKAQIFPGRERCGALIDLQNSQSIYRVFIKYCVFFLKFCYFLYSASSAAALEFYLPGVCTHTDTKRKQRKARVRNILKYLKRTQYLMNILYFLIHQR